MSLRTDYKNDVLNTSVNEERRFEEVTNPDGTKSYRDVTDYSQVGDNFDADIVNSQNAEINAKAPIESPTFTGNPEAPTQSQNTADDTIATTAFVKSAFNNFVDPNLRTSGKAADAQATGNRIASIQSSIPIVDNTLSISGGAADSKVVGDRISATDAEFTELKNDLTNADGELKLVWEQGTLKLLSEGGGEQDSSSRIRTTYFHRYSEDPITISTPSGYLSSYRGYTLSDGVYTCVAAGNFTNDNYTLDRDIYYRLLLRRQDNSDFTPSEAYLPVATENMYTDTTLSIPGKAADAASIGLAIDNVSKMFVQDSDELLTTSASQVLVSNNNTPFGFGGSVIFEKRNEKKLGYKRNDGSVVFPKANGTILCDPDAPIFELMSVIKTWVGRNNIIHNVDNDTYTSLFGDNCVADSNGKIHMDCSDFVCAVLMGITYDNSRIVLGNDAENRPLRDIFNSMPCLNKGNKTKGGLYTWEMAQWFAENNRLFELPKSTTDRASMLQFGDVLFSSSDESFSDRYYSIGHCMFVLGTIKYPVGSEKVVVAHCSSEVVEGTDPGAIYVTTMNLGASSIRVFGRPKYLNGHDHPLDSSIIPEANGTYKYNVFLLPKAEILLDSTSGVQSGEISLRNVFSSTLRYYPAIPGSSLLFTGTGTSDRGNYLVRVAEYDSAFKLVKRPTTILSNGKATPLTVSSSTKYVRFGFGRFASSNAPIWLSETDDFKITITLPND